MPVIARNTEDKKVAAEKLTIRRSIVFTSLRSIIIVSSTAAECKSDIAVNKNNLYRYHKYILPTKHIVSVVANTKSMLSNKIIKLEYCTDK